MSIAFVGPESFVGSQGERRELSSAVLAAWLDLVESTGAWQEEIGQVGHFLYVGRRGEETET